ncbi:hypothetical protein [Photobacterium sanguinicancri]|uniref:Uncharacterized protein n=1 Tax=Photobacterium sanguinicancri TaxID=875932 RepID=A0AAW7YC04_9GAMM|nr:hypothetical protein [Photobacterium sanguinicancri]KXI24293.1 hypothetical protein AS132_02180 [Photobacterium sanguinicancri]MDO6544547.1 hypothetical protein [Photobacterium sanguinicancri]
MLAESKQVILTGDKTQCADIRIIPTGIIEVDIPSEERHYEADFAQLYFYTHTQKTELVCRSEQKNDVVQWKLEIANDDARELLSMIERAEDEFEQLMRSL